MALKGPYLTRPYTARRGLTRPCKAAGQNSSPASILDESSASGAGMYSLFDYVDYAGQELEVVITENVSRQFATRHQFGGEIPISVQNDGFRRRGFLPVSMVLNTANYALKHSRSRGWGIYFRLMAMKAAFPPLQSTMLSLELQPLPADKYLADLSTKTLPSVIATTSPYFPRGKNGKPAPKWVQDLAKIRQRYGKDLHDLEGL